MSRVHISVNLKSSVDKNEVVYEVLSPDFSDSGIDEQTIGELSLKLDGKDFSYEPRADLKQEFFPPEYFNKYSFDEVEDIAREKNYYSTAWSYIIYKNAVRLLEDKIEEASTSQSQST